MLSRVCFGTPLSTERQEILHAAQHVRSKLCFPRLAPKRPALILPPKADNLRGLYKCIAALQPGLTAGGTLDGQGGDGTRGVMVVKATCVSLCHVTCHQTSTQPVGCNGVAPKLHAACGLQWCDTGRKNFTVSALGKKMAPHVYVHASLSKHGVSTCANKI